ncbi:MULTISPECIES: GFA family protein [unclassified Novosphingobium]|uniref:GFA family protein n=1 Tax=unclassified Novosphingobium TaxID=2644732 RepID=UPI000EEB88AF|nr:MULTISPECIES: GFA family protein [unclassified Novosphingobium]HCF24719.1 aldehyde-activating protein [Novosphingobium sp.]HQV02072.1 GFA family protein [Novosphingobium sp.]
MSEHRGSCHCGAITLVLRETPADVAECNCSLCRRTGGLWHHTVPAMVTAAGTGVAYRQGDCMLDTWHCATCGCTTHWTPVDPDYPRMAVNLRMFEPELWQNLPRRFIDGASY